MLQTEGGERETSVTTISKSFMHIFNVAFPILSLQLDAELMQAR